MTLQDLQALFSRDIASVRTHVEAYPEEGLLWRTTEDTPNSTGTLALHLTGNLRAFVGATLGNTGFVRDREGEFPRRKVPREEILEGLFAAEKDVRTTLSSLDPSALEKPFPMDFGEHRIDTALFLMHLATHLAYHLGQIDAHRRRFTGQAAIPGTGRIPFAD